MEQRREVGKRPMGHRPVRPPVMQQPRGRAIGSRGLGDQFGGKMKVEFVRPHRLPVASFLHLCSAGFSPLGNGRLKPAPQKVRPSHFYFDRSHAAGRLACPRSLVHRTNVLPRDNIRHNRPRPFPRNRPRANSFLSGKRHIWPAAPLTPARVLARPPLCSAARRGIGGLTHFPARRGVGPEGGPTDPRRHPGGRHRLGARAAGQRHRPRADPPAAAAHPPRPGLRAATAHSSGATIRAPAGDPPRAAPRAVPAHPRLPPAVRTDRSEPRTRSSPEPDSAPLAGAAVAGARATEAGAQGRDAPARNRSSRPAPGRVHLRMGQFQQFVFSVPR